MVQTNLMSSHTNPTSLRKTLPQMPKSTRQHSKNALWLRREKTVRSWRVTQIRLNKSPQAIVIRRFPTTSELRLHIWQNMSGQEFSGHELYRLGAPSRQTTRIAGACWQIPSMNAPVLVDLEGETDPLQIAIKELNQKKIPLIVRRYLPDGW